MSTTETTALAVFYGAQNGNRLRSEIATQTQQ